MDKPALTYETPYSVISETFGGYKVVFDEDYVLIVCKFKVEADKLCGLLNAAYNYGRVKERHENQ